MHRRLRWTACWGMLLWTGAGQAQDRDGAPPAPPTTGTLRGILLEQGTRTPQPGLLVRLSARVEPVLTDANGVFEVSDLAPGSVQIVIEDEAFARVEDEAKIVAGERTEITWYLTPVGFDDAAVRVVGRRTRKDVVRRVITAREIQTVAGTNGDPLVAVQSLPGAARLPFGQGDVVLRGGGDTRAALNGQWLPSTFHFGGLRSVVSGALISTLDVVPGNYGPEFGRGNGGLVAVQTRRPRGDRFGGKARVDLFDAELLLEGPLTENSTFAVAGRRSYIDAVLPVVLSDDSPFKTAPRYWDAQAVHDYRAGDHRVSTLVFASNDTLVLLFDDPPEGDPAVRGAFDVDEGFVGAQSTWRTHLSDDTKSALMLGYLRYTARNRLGQAIDLDIDLQVMTIREKIEHQFSDGFALSGGLDVELIWGDFTVRAPLPGREGTVDGPLSTATLRSTSATPFYNQPAAWVQASLTWGDLTLLPGVRADYSGVVSEAVVQPRAVARYVIRPSSVVKAGAGLYAEHPDLEETDPVFGNPDLQHERGQQYSLGFEQGLTESLSVDVTGFYKRFTRLVRRVDDPQVQALNQGEGQAYGAEVLIRHAPGGRFYGWLAYTFMRSERRDGPGEPWRVFDFDQTHILNVVGQMRLSRIWEVGGRFRYVTGNPTTPLNGANFDSDADTFVPIAGKLNSARLPAFHQLDLRIDKHWLFDQWTLTTYLEVQNVYVQENAEGLTYNFDYTQSTRAAGLPILPTFGLQGAF